MTLLYVIGEGGRPSYALHTDNTEVIIPGQDETTSSDVLRGGKPIDAIDRLEEAGQAITDACEHILQKVRSGLADAKPSELELTFTVGFAGEGGLPVLAKASAEAGIQIRALWKSPEASP